jgi:PAS domain S-box-containing protein
MTTRHQECRTEGLPAGQADASRRSQPAEPGLLLIPRQALGPSADELLSLVGDGVISTDGQGTILLFNEAAAEMFGYTADEVLGEPVGMLLPARHRDSHHSAVLRFGASTSEARRFMGYRREVVGRKKSGQEFPAEASLSRRTMRGQQVLTVAIRDVSERRMIEEERRLVTAELAHRFKNCLAVVNSIVSLSARDAKTVDTFRDALQGRLRAIASTQDVLLEDGATGAALTQLLEAELKPYARGDELRISLDGPAVTVPAHSALRLTLALHELATNAAKYGALSKPGGSLEISWRAQEQRGGSVLVLDWKEAGGPPVKPRRRRGFGSDLIERCLGSSNVHLSFHGNGLEAEVKLPLSQGGWTETSKDRAGK